MRVNHLETGGIWWFIFMIYTLLLVTRKHFFYLKELFPWYDKYTDVLNYPSREGLYIFSGISDITQRFIVALYFLSLANIKPTTAAAMQHAISDFMTQRPHSLAVRETTYEAELSETQSTLSYQYTIECDSLYISQTYKVSCDIITILLIINIYVNLNIILSSTEVG